MTQNQHSERMEMAIDAARELMRPGTVTHGAEGGLARALLELVEQYEGVAAELRVAQAQITELTRDGGGDSIHLRIASEARERMHVAEDEAASLKEQLEAIQKRIEEAVSIMPDPMHPHFQRDKVDAQARAIRLLTLEDPYPAKSPPTLSDDNPASVVGVPWNEDGYADDSNQEREP